jgi:glucosamine-6-phosphate deaminase
LGINLHIHQDRTTLTEAAGKQAAAMLRLAIVSSGSAGLILSGDPEVEGIIDFLASREGLDWKKVFIFPVCEFIGLSKISRGSLQNDLYKKIIAANGEVNTKCLINGEAIPASEIKRISECISKVSPVLVLTGAGHRGEIGLTDDLAKDRDTSGYLLAEPGEPLRKELVRPNRFRTIHEVPRKGITISMKSLLSSKNIITCLTGKSKSGLAAKLNESTEPEFPCQLLSRHPNFYLHLDRDAASDIPDSESKA